MDVAFYLPNTIIVPLLVRFVIFSGRFRVSETMRGGLAVLLAFVDAALLLWHDCQARIVPYYMALFVVCALLVPEKSATPLTRAWGRRRFSIFLLSVITVSSLLYVHLPIGTFLTSPGEIGIHLEYLMTNNVRSATAGVYWAALGYAFVVSPRAKSALTLLAVCVAAVVLLYSFVLPFGYPMMSGVMFEQIRIPQTELMLRATADGALCVVVCTLLVKLLLKFGAQPLFVGLLITNLSLAVSSGLSVSRDTDPALAEGASEDQATDETPLRFSKTEPNVLIIFLDRFMGGYVEGIIEKHPDLAARLDGFTWYPKTLAAGQNSIAGVHPIFGGYDYTPKEMNARGEFLRDVSVEAYRILPYNFSKKGYQVNFANPRGLGFTMQGDCRYLEMDGVHCTHIAPKVTQRLAKQFGMSMNVLAESNYADLLVLLGAMRAVPYWLKGGLHKLGPWKPFMDHSAGTTFQQWAELKALPELSRTDAKKSNLNIMWSILPHEPYFMGEDCKPQKTRLQVSDEEVRRRGYSSLFGLQHAVTARCSLLLVADYMDFLKEQGVYDNTKVVVVSDHGIVGPAEDHSSRAKAGGTTENIYVRSRSVLLVKGEEAHGPLSASEEFMPNADVPRLVCEQIGGCVNPYLDNKSIERHGREDPFYVDFVPWRFNRQKPNAFVIKHELQLKNGDPYDAKNWSNLPKE